VLDFKVSMFYIIAACLLYSAAILLGTYASRNANTNLVAAIVNIVSSLIPTVVVFASFSEKLKASTKAGLLAAGLGGVLIAFFVMALNKAYSEENVAIISPIVFGGSIAITSVASYFIFKEKIVGLQLVGLVLVLIGLSLVVISRLKTA
jgi:drug/metabolite transporter (DMT)-like permease